MVTSATKFTIDMMLEVYKTVLRDEGALYCSAPVTSGRRYIEWLRRTGKEVADIDGLDCSEKEAHLSEVVRLNCIHASQIVQRLREGTEKIVIDPTAMSPLPGWTQKDWRYFWRQVIDRYATIVVFVNDWQYSNGCVYEFWVAQTKGIHTMDEEMRTLDLETGIALITEAVAELKRYDGTTAFIEQVLRDLQNLLSMSAKQEAK